MQDELELIKKNLLSKLHFINNGFANLQLDQTASKYVSADEKTSVALGIDDRFANYFYLRSDGNIYVNANVSQLTSNRKTVEFDERIVLIVNVVKCNTDKLIKMVMTALSESVGEPFEVNSILYTNEKVVISEFSFLSKDNQKNILARLGKRVLLKIEFKLFTIFQPNRTTTDPLTGECIEITLN